MDLNKQIEMYADRFPVYELFAKKMDAILRAAFEPVIPGLIIQSRPKEISSFAEKAVRKADKYPDPVNNLTDLCGARVILHTLDEVELICKFIKEKFRIHEEEDIAERLETSAFGYLSHHYIIEPFKDNDYDGCISEEDWKTFEKIKENFRAEVQVRTLLQHAWADTVHDRVYKTQVNVPVKYKRLASRLAALMENGDQGYAELAKRVDDFRTYYGAYMSDKQMDEEIKTLREIMVHTKDEKAKDKLRLNIMRIERSRYNWAGVIQAALGRWLPKEMVQVKSDDETLPDLEELFRKSPYHTDFRGVIDTLSGKSDGAFLQELGNALCQIRKNFRDANHRLGIACLERARQLNPSDVESIILLARSYAHYPEPCNVSENEAAEAREARENMLKYFGEAFAAAPQNPYALCYCLEHKLAASSDPKGTLDLLRPMLGEAIEVARSHVKAGIELPRALFVLGRLFLLQGNRSKGLGYYAKAINFCRGINESVGKGFLESELEALETRIAKLNLKEVACAARFFKLALRVLFTVDRGLDSLAEGRTFFSEHKNDREIMILAGTTRPDLYPKEWDALLLDSFKRFEGVLVSGGTKYGIANAAYEIASQAHDEKRKVSYVAYIPDSMPTDQKTHKPYACHAGPFVTNIEVRNSINFESVQVIQYWTDMMAGGVEPKNVKLLCMGGGDISRFECEIALALGAKVAAVMGSDRAAKEILEDPDWNDALDLLVLSTSEAKVRGPNRTYTMPLEMDSIRNFAEEKIRKQQGTINQDQIDNLARKLHDKYLDDQLNGLMGAKPAYKKWDDLAETYQQANLELARDIFFKLESHGFTVAPMTSVDKGKKIEQLLEDEGVPEFIDQRKKEPSFNPADVIVSMARDEHGRWVVDRLKDGWRYSPKRDENKKTHDCLVAWDQLTPKVQGYDLDAIYAIPESLKAIGFKIVRKNGPVS